LPAAVAGVAEVVATVAAGAAAGLNLNQFLYIYCMIANDVIYPSKKGVVIYIPIVILTAVVIFSIISGDYWGSIFCLLIVLAVIGPMILNTNYTIKGDGSLRVKCGFLINILIDIKSIRKIETTKSVLSSPALSLHRLEVFYNKYDSVMISPQNKEDFVAQLQNINPAIEYIKKAS
jgi:preprotein translocase subunit SecE